MPARKPLIPERKPGPKVQQVFDLIDSLATGVVEDLRDDETASHSQLVAWSIDADRLMRSRLLLGSIDLN